MIAATIIGLASILIMKVIAESMETKEQLSILQSFGCDQYHGYFFSRPLNASALSQELLSAAGQVCGKS